jgi:hypothetical protein
MSENPRSNQIWTFEFCFAMIAGHRAVLVALFVVIHFFDYISIFIVNFLRDATYMLR